MSDARQVDDDHHSKAIPHRTLTLTIMIFRDCFKDKTNSSADDAAQRDRKHLHTKLVSRGGDGDIDGHRLIVGRLA